MSVKPYNQLHPLAQIGLLFIMFFAGQVIGAVIALVLDAIIYGSGSILQITHLSSSLYNTAGALRLLQGLSALFGFFGVALFFGYVVVREPDAYLKSNTRFSPILLLLVLAIMIGSQPFMQALININQQMALPGFLKGVENWMRVKENENQALIETMLKMNNAGDLAACLFVIAFIAALGEEFIFRGCLQTILTRWTRNQHTAIWVTAIIFSAVHMEFFGFFPRMALGVLFGYFCAWSGSIWPSVLAHFINNGTAVLATYLYQHKQVSTDPDMAQSFNYTTYALSIIITVFLMLNYRTAAQNKPRINHN